MNYRSQAQQSYPQTPPAGYQQPVYQGYPVPQPQYPTPDAPIYSPAGPAQKKRGRCRFDDNSVMTLTVNLTVSPRINYNANLVSESGSWKINQIKRQQ